MSKKLFIPGPVEVHPEILQAMATPMIGHRMKEYAVLHGAVKEKLKKLLKDKAFLATSWLPTSSAAFDKNSKPYPYDPKKAKELMAKAGYPNGFAIDQAIGTGNDSWGVVVYEAMLPYLKEIGITLKIQQMEGAAMVERIKNGEFQTFIWSMGSGPDILGTLNRFSAENTRAGGNYFDYKNPEFDNLLKQAAADLENTMRVNAEEAARTLADQTAKTEAAPSAPAIIHTVRFDHFTGRNRK